jgi:hypothetical protein
VYQFKDLAQDEHTAIKLFKMLRKQKFAELVMSDNERIRGEDHVRAPGYKTPLGYSANPLHFNVELVLEVFSLGVGLHWSKILGIIVQEINNKVRR